MRWFRELSTSQQGIVFMVMAVGTLACMDAMAKHLSQSFAPFQVVWARYFFQSVIVLAIFAPRLRRLMRTRYLWLQLVRSAFLFAATLSFFTALSMGRLADLTAVFEVAPLFVTIAAALVLGERAGPRRLGAVAAGLVGALIIIRPSGDIPLPAALLTLTAAACFAGFAISTRFLGREESLLTSLIYSTLVGTAVASLLVIPHWQMPGATGLAQMVLIGAIGSLGQWLLIRAFTQAEAGIVAPFSYVGLLFALVIGFTVFGEWPDAMTLLGATIIVGAGLYVWHRERRVEVEALP